MSTDESLEDQTKLHSESVAAEAIDWGFQFLKILEFEYSNAAAEFPAQATIAEFRRAMIRAFEGCIAGQTPSALCGSVNEMVS